MTAEEYFKKWSENCRIFENYSPIHSDEDTLKFAEDYARSLLLSKEEIEERTADILLSRTQLLGYENGATWANKAIENKIDGSKGT